jgi:hypothetical protein
MAYCSVNINAPGEAEEGKSISVTVTLNNTDDTAHTFRYTVEAVPDLSGSFPLGEVEKLLSAGAYYSRGFSFRMPDSRTTILVWVEYWTGSSWSYVASKSAVISLKLPVPGAEFRNLNVSVS